MWIKRTSRGRRDLPESVRDVEGIWAGWEAGAGVVGGAVVGCVGCDGAEELALLDEGSAGGVSGCVEGAGWDWLGDAIVL